MDENTPGEFSEANEIWWCLGEVLMILARLEAGKAGESGEADEADEAGKAGDAGESGDSVDAGEISSGEMGERSPGEIGDAFQSFSCLGEFLMSRVRFIKLGEARWMQKLAGCEVYCTSLFFIGMTIHFEGNIIVLNHFIGFL